MPTSFEVRADAHAYRVDIASSGVDAFLQSDAEGKVLVCDEIFLDRLKGLPLPVIGLAALETEKTLDAAGRVVKAISQAKLSRSGQIVAVGGGIIQDVACFAASIYKRGVAWSYCPTTLLGMADSCLGGKSSINVGDVKNLVGTIHPPERIFVDTSFVETLPIEHRVGGLCEAAKIAFARGPEPFARYLALDPLPNMPAAALADVIEISLVAKKWFVEVDEFDKRERLTLNLGHTFGHALESATDFALNHGAAVGVGILCAAAFVREDGGALHAGAAALEKHTRELLASHPGLGEILHRADMTAFDAAFTSDKKHARDSFTLVLPVESRDLGLPLSLCRFPRGPETMHKIHRAIDVVCKGFRS